MAKRTPEIIKEARRRQKLFAKTRGMVLRDYEGVRDKEIREILKILNVTRKQVLAEIATSDWKAFSRPQLIDAIDRQIDTFRVRAGAQALGAQETFWQKGQALVDAPMIETGISVGLPELSTTVLDSFNELTIDLISNLTDAARRNIGREIRIGMLGGKTPFEVMEAVGMNLKDPSVFRTIAVRAEAIVRTEYGRVFGKAGQLRMKQAAVHVPELKKEWRWSGRQRQEHAMIDGQVREVDEEFDIPLPGGAGSVQGSYPRDPKLPASASVNCGCQSLPLIEQWEGIISRQGMAIAV